MPPTTERGLRKLMLMTRLMMSGRAQEPETTPTESGLAYEDVAFTATDGVDLRGWFIPAGPLAGPVVVFVHGWLWNRLGNVEGRVPFRDATVDFLPATKALHDAGFHVLLFDLSNHGESAKRSPLTFGPWEARDFIGAVRYLRTRPDVDPNRLGVVGCSAGANTAIYGTPGCQPVKAILAVQPTRLARFNHHFAHDELGPLGPLAARSMDLLYIAMRAPLPSKHDPGIPARRLGDTVVQYVQGLGDPWGEMGIVEDFSAVTPHSLGVIKYPSPPGRYEGYQYVSKEAGDVVAFFSARL